MIRSLAPCIATVLVFSASAPSLSAAGGPTARWPLVGDAIFGQSIAVHDGRLYVGT